jgi:hypothetical protein
METYLKCSGKCAVAEYVLNRYIVLLTYSLMELSPSGEAANSAAS